MTWAVAAAVLYLLFQSVRRLRAGMFTYTVFTSV